MYSSAERPYVAPGPLGRLCRGAFYCTRVTWTAVQRGLLLHKGQMEGNKHCAVHNYVVNGKNIVV